MEIIIPVIDVHSHILYGIDDGAKNIEESVAILKKMAALGYSKLILTPHYMEDAFYIANNKKKKELLKTLEQALQRENIPLTLYLGQEIFIGENIIKSIKKDSIMSMNGTKVLLIEVPMHDKMVNDLDLLGDLIYQGYTIVLAHPERYLFFQENPKLIEDYLEMGILLQGNIESIGGKYGKNVEKLSKYLLKNKKYFTLASDVHSENSHFYNMFPKLEKKIKKITKEEYFKELMEINPEKIIKGEI